MMEFLKNGQHTVFVLKKEQHTLEGTRLFMRAAQRPVYICLHSVKAMTLFLLVCTRCPKLLIKFSKSKKKKINVALRTPS